MGTVSTQLTSGVLTFEAENGRDLGQSSSKAWLGIWYQKNSGSQIYAEFLYQASGVTHWDQGAFYQSAGTTRSYSWSGVPANCSFVGGMWVQNQQTFLTPPTSGC